MNPIRTLAATAAILVLALPGRGRAQVSPELEGLLNEPVVSTASRTAETAELAPATTTTITSDDLRRHGISSLDDAIDYLALGMVVEHGFAFGEIGVRGVLLTRDYGNHVLVLVNGHAVNEAWDGAAYFDRSAAIPFDLVDRIEVILGPGSVLYGSQAMLGVINVITRTAREYAGVHVVAEGGAPWVARGALGYGRELDLAGTRGEVVVGVEGFRSWGPPHDYALQTVDGATWGGEATHRSVRVPSAYAHLALGGFALDLRAASARRAAVSRAGSFDDLANWDGDRWLSADLRWSGTLAGRVKGSARLYGDLYRYAQRAPDFTPERDCLEGQVEGCTYELDGRSGWAGAEGIASLDWFGDGREATQLGVDARLTRVGQDEAYRDDATGEAVPTSSFDRNEHSVGAWVQQVAQLAPWLNVNAGLRLDHDPLLGAHWSPRMAVVLPAWAGGIVKAIYSEAFRAPTGFERFYSDPTAFVAAPGLKPEQVRSVEGAVEQRWGAERVRLSVFRSWWTDLVTVGELTPEELAAAIDRGELTPGTEAASTYRNAARLDAWGLGADWEGSQLGRRLRYGAAISATRSRQEGQPLPVTSSLSGNARVSYDLGDRLPLLGLAVRFVGYRLVAGSRFTPTPEVPPRVELRATASGPIAGTEHLSWTLTANAALHDLSAYAVGPLRAPAPGYPAQEVSPDPGRMLLVGVRGDW